ncbi:MAG: type II toxin-antitoxin system RelE/ParE family toxin [Planctomycetaceae bacterium]|nr:type II toxin-antitoxin system RelE/ParE family toxin [Planctomycetaceae bacterium]MCA9110796.1 type II toxin-antitoxin system RelE/ParE family toxin [Planctomycetaceae bacterium]
MLISPRANMRLVEATEWYRQVSGDSEVADRWLTGFLMLLSSLEQQPDRHPPASERDDLGIDVREVHYGSGRRLTHRALFRIQGEVVEVLTIRHTAEQDVTRGDLGLE